MLILAKNSLRKDHKKSVVRLEQQEDGTVVNYDEGPPVRPVCDVSDGVSHKLSYLLSNIVDEICNGDTVCNSTEEMLSSIEECNRRGIEEGDVIGSADVKSLYPKINYMHVLLILTKTRIIISLEIFKLSLIGFTLIST